MDRRTIEAQELDEKTQDPAFWNDPKAAEATMKKVREAEQLIAKALSGSPTNEIARELRELLQNIYAQSGRDEDVFVYQLEVPDRERSRFEAILNQFGLTTSNMRRVIGHVALL